MIPLIMVTTNPVQCGGLLRYLWWLVVVVVAFVVGQSQAFSSSCLRPPLGLVQSNRRTFRQSSSLHMAVNVGQKFYNLEELEDSETCTTEIFLNADQTVDVGETDGPVFIKASGTWTQERSKGGDDPGSFQMTLLRTYEAGREASSPTDMGEFHFTVERTFTGIVTKVGSSVAVTGSMHHVDELSGGDQQVGYFNMIDTTKERLGEKDD